MATVKSENVIKAEQILSGALPSRPYEMYELAQKLKKENAFHYGRRILARLRKSQFAELELTEKLKVENLRVKLAQQHALFTYKDKDLPTKARLDRAFEILSEVEDLSNTKDQETLGLAGAIFKQRWEAEGHLRHLERSLAYYHRGYKEGVASDYGYTAINAAYVLDLFARQESIEAEKAGTLSESAEARREEARQIREKIVSTLPGLLTRDENKWLEQQWWFLVTMAEAHFGLGELDEASSWLDKAKALKEVESWQYESTVKQLANIARLQAKGSSLLDDYDKSPVYKVLTGFLDKKYVAGVRTALTGKVGLALSGSGFRASLFHIGVLAKLAELDVLRDVEVLSCVSGGAVIGAYYYLEVRKLLKQKEDSDIRCSDYVEIVKRIEEKFLDGVQRNIRARLNASNWAHFKLTVFPYYSRTDRIGELLEEEIFSWVDDGHGRKPRLLNELTVEPKGEAESFAPKNDNWRRAAKVPLLILNATTLNTGHNWQFTTSWMGEPPTSLSDEMDGNARLRRVYYSEAPEKYQTFSLGRAVAASACVPGMFDPVVLQDLYPDMVVRLVDGGCRDSEGLNALLDEECKVVIVADGSGQTTTQWDPGSGFLEVPRRSNNILTAKVREEQYDDLYKRKLSSLIREFVFVHLKKDLHIEPVTWVGSQETDDRSDDGRSVELRGPLTRYGIRKDVQMRLAEIRTDLDSFSDTEAYALMTSGYLMTEYEFRQGVTGFKEPQRDRPQWRFLALEEPMKRVGKDDILNLLPIGRNQASRVLKLSTTVRSVTKLLGVIGVSILIYLLSQLRWGAVFGINIAILIYWTAAIVSTFIVWLWMLQKAGMRKPVRHVVIGMWMATFGWIGAFVQLYVIDRIYLSKGRIYKSGADLAEAPTVTATQSAPIRAINRLIDGTDEARQQLKDRSYWVNKISRLFEASGYRVECFPRDRSINPLQFDIDIFARKNNRATFVEVKTQADAAGQNYLATAIALKTAAVLWSQQETRQESSSALKVNALLLLIDIEKDESVMKVCENAGVKVVYLKSEQLSGLKSAEERSQEAERLGILGESDELNVLEPLKPLQQAGGQSG